MKDAYGRSLEILRVSVTDKCNFRCVYCMPPEGVPDIPHERILRFEEILDIIRTAVGLGMTRIRLTGGEPLVRKGMPELVRMIAGVEGIMDLAMTTNGSLLAPVAHQLKSAGLMRVNISLDTMDPIRFTGITRGGRLQDVLDGIDASVDAGLTPVKLNIVVADPAFDGDAISVKQYAAGKNLLSRRIRQMDIRKGVFGVVQHSNRGDCQACNRIRLTCDGYIRSCLLSDIKYDVRELGAEKAIRAAIENKPERGIRMNTGSMNRVGG